MMVKKNGKTIFERPALLPHGKSNSCGGSIGFYKMKTLELIKKTSDTSRRILLLLIKLEYTKISLVNICN